MNDTAAEIASQPDVWLKSLALTDQAQHELIAPGERMLVLGCGTSWFVAQALAELREGAGFGETDVICASEFRPRRRYDRIVAVTRSGTSTEVLEALRMIPAATRTVAITAVRGEPVDDLTDAQLVLDFADERSVVQTRFPTTVLALARQAFGAEKTGLIFGWIMASHQIGAALAASVAGVIRTSEGSYDHAFILAGSLCLVTAIGVLFAVRGNKT